MQKPRSIAACVWTRSPLCHLDISEYSRRSATTLAFGLLLIASGCSSGADTSGTNSSDDIESESGGFNDIEAGSMTLDDFVSFDVSSQIFIKNAVGEMTRRCMEAAGFEYHPYAYQEDEIVQVFRSPEQLRSSGYSISNAEWSQELDPNQTVLAGLSAEDQARWTDSLFGSDEDEVEVILKMATP